MAAASASAKALPRLGSRQLAGQDHLERDGPVETYLPRLVNDTHAATGDFLQQLVVAEIADHVFWTRLRRLTWRERECVGQWRGGPPEAIMIGEESSQFVRKVDMPGQERCPVRQFTSLDRAQVIRDDFVDTLVLCGAFRIGGRHRYVSTGKCWRRLCIPRLIKPATATGVRPRCSPTSSNVQPSKWCSVMARD